MYSILNLVHTASLLFITLTSRGREKSKRSKTLSFWIDYAENNEINPPISNFLGAKRSLVWKLSAELQNDLSKAPEGRKYLQGRRKQRTGRAREQGRHAELCLYITLLVEDFRFLWLADHTSPYLDLVREKRRQIPSINEVQVSFCLPQASMR